MRIIYSNGNGNSGISEVYISDNYMDITFANGGEYRYEKDNVGDANFAIMKALTLHGTGLNTFINRYVRGTKRHYTVPTPEPKPQLNAEDATALLVEFLNDGRVSLQVN